MDGLGIDKVSGEQIAYCDSKLIRRNKIQSFFWTAMEEVTRGTAKLAFTLFDRYGRLDSDVYEHDTRKGTGVWGMELDQGDILFFDFIKVSPQWRRKQIASAVVGAILDKARRKSKHFFALVEPGFLYSELPSIDSNSEEAVEKSKDMMEQAAEDFWRSVGFRRVGTTTWLAFSDDANHPSRQLTSADDCGFKSPEDCYTPLEAAHWRLDQKRTRTEVQNTLGRIRVLSDEFQGFTQAEVSRLAGLANTEAFDLSKLSDQDIAAV